MRTSLGSLLVALALTGASAASTSTAIAQGFPNVAQTPGTLLSGLNAPQQGRTAIIAYHNGLLFTVPEQPSSQPGSDFQVRTWDLSDPTNPVQLATLGITPQPINAHGYFKSGDYLVLGSNWPPEAPWSFRATPTFGVVQRTEFPNHQGAGVRGNLFQPWFVGETYWSYGEVAGNATIERDFQVLAEWDHLGLTGVVGHPFLLGDLLIFASDQSRTGVATYDVSDPTNPVLLDVLTTGGPGGYWPELWGSGDGRLYIVFPYRTGGNGFRVVDATDPTDLQFLTDRPLPGDESMYIQFQDEYAFMGGHKVDMRTFQSVLFLDGDNVAHTNGGGTGISTSQFLLPLGNLLVTGGIGPNQGMAVWAHQAAPDTRGPSVGYHIPQAGRTNYPVGAPISLLIHETLETSTLVNGVSFLVRPLGGSPIAGRITFAFDDILTFTPTNPLAANTTYEVLLPAGGIEDAAGNGMVEYSFTFSTGSAVGGNGAPTLNSFTASAYPVAPGQSATLTASATDPESDPIEYRFDFGDGSATTAWSSSASAQHTWAAPGHYQATVQARDNSGSLTTSRLTVTVVNPPAGPAPTHSTSIACDHTNRRIWTVNPDNNTLAAFDADSLSKDLEVAACEDPRSLARAASGHLWVACHDDDTLRVFTAAGTPVETLDVGYGSAPTGLALSPDGATAYLTLEGRGELRRYNTATRTHTGTLPLGPGPRALAVSGDGSRVYVTRFRSPLHHAEVWEVDTTTLTLARTLTIPKFGGDQNRDTTASGRGVANYLAGIALSPDGQSAWVVANKPNSERGLVFAQDLDSDNTVRSLLVRIDLNTGTFADAVDLDNSDSPSAVAFSPLGDYVFVTLQGNNTVQVLDALAMEGTTGLGSFVSNLGTGLAPQGVCVDPTTHRVLVKNFMGRSLTALEADPLFRTGNKNLTASHHSTVATETLSPTVLTGKEVFYNAGDPRMSAEGYMSCASCHLDGGHDGRVWDFTGRGEGFRNTTTLRGRGGLAQGNVHWTANFDEIQDFENDMRNGFGGLGFLDNSDFATTAAPLGPAKAGLDPELDALAAYVASLGQGTLPRSPFRNADGSLTAQAQAGRTLFANLGCSSCHQGSNFTNSTQGTATLTNVGTLRTTSGGRLGGALPGIDTPTLRGVWNTPPYLHDGSAETLEEVFRVAGGEVLEAEDGTPSGATNVVTNYVDLNNDDTVHNRSYVAIGPSGSSLVFNNIDGGAGGPGALEIRYSAGYHAHDLQFRVNGVLQPLLTVDPTGNDPQWRHTNWERARLENVTWNTGTGNTLEITTPEGSTNLSLDNIVITTADNQAQAEPHRTVLSLSQGDQDALLAYLRQLDGSPEANPDTALFEDGFESGNTVRWSNTVP